MAYHYDTILTYFNDLNIIWCNDDIYFEVYDLGIDRVGDIYGIMKYDTKTKECVQIAKEGQILGCSYYQKFIAFYDKIKKQVVIKDKSSEMQIPDSISDPIFTWIGDTNSFAYINPAEKTLCISSIENGKIVSKKKININDLTADGERIINLRCEKEEILFDVVKLKIEDPQYFDTIIYTKTYVVEW